MSRWAIPAATVLVACAQPSSSQSPDRPAPPPRAVKTATATLPADVVAFRTRRDLCDHWQGEEAYDAARAAQIVRGVRKTCTGTDAALKALKAKYRRNAAVVAALAGYEERVE